jgi:glycosyltransferase involved in cell wall biosynthesis
MSLRRFPSRYQRALRVCVASASSEPSFRVSHLVRYSEVFNVAFCGKWSDVKTCPPNAISICHRSVTSGDAIGNDIIGSYQLLERMGFSPTVLCQFADDSISGLARIDSNLDPDRVSKTYDLLLYHHSIEWRDGEAIINAFSGPVVAKYHNITPGEFFAPYTAEYEAICHAGRNQTARLAHNGRVRMWQAASSYNAQELITLGVTASQISVVPPFNRIADMLFVRHRADYRSGQCAELLFVGRRAPHKGHRHLLRMLDSYIRLFSGDVRLRIVGNADEQLRSYTEELLALADRLGVARHLDWITHISDDELDGLFRRSHVYVNASEHEGFCVPIIEAQAVGLPVVTVDSTALKETAGENQLVCPPLTSDDSYDFMAGLVHEVMINHTLREQLIQHGFRNIYERFLPEDIEDLFVSSLEPVWRNSCG